MKLNSASDFSLIATQADTLFVSDHDGRLLFVNEPFDPKGTPAPLVFVGQSDDGFLCRFRHDIPQRLCDQVEQIVETYRTNSSSESTNLVDSLRQCMQVAGWRVGKAFEGPAYHFPEGSKQDYECVVIDAAQASLLRTHLSDIIPELGANHPCVTMMVDGNAVSVCRTVRRSSRAAEAGVVTAADYRGRGFATRVVGHWASLVSASGLMPLYSASRDNHASRRVAEKLGLVQYGTDLSLMEQRT